MSNQVPSLIVPWGSRDYPERESPNGLLLIGEPRSHLRQRDGGDTVPAPAGRFHNVQSQARGVNRGTLCPGQGARVKTGLVRWSKSGGFCWRNRQNQKVNSS